MPFVFTRERWARLAEHRDQDHAVLVHVSLPVSPQAVRRIWKQYETHDEDGNLIGTTRVRIDDVLTVLLAYRVDVYAATGLSKELAKACGYQTVSGLRGAWQATHPRSPLAQAVWFRLGDIRDRPRYLTATPSMRWGPGKPSWRTRPPKPMTPAEAKAKRLTPDKIERFAHGDYTGNPRQACDDAEALSPAEYAALGAFNRQRDLRRLADVAAANAAQTASERMARIEAGGRVAMAIARHELRGLERAVDREHQRLARSA